MRRLAVGIVQIAFVILADTDVLAQSGGYMVQTPGEPTTFVNPTFGGGYMIQTPGQPTTFVSPTFGGGSMIQTPGQSTTFVNSLSNLSYGQVKTCPNPGLGQVQIHSNPMFGKQHCPN